MGAVAKVPVRMTVAEFLVWDAGDGRLWQLVDGEPQAMAPASRTHGAIQAELSRLIANHLSERSSLCSVLANPDVVPRIQAEHNVRIPDLAVICSDYEAEEPVIADPTLIVEIFRPATRPRPGPTFGPIRRFQASGRSSFCGPFRLPPIFCAAAPMAPGRGRRKRSRREI